MEGFFGSEGKLITFMTKLGQLILLSLVFLLCCIPVVTIGDAYTALYYAVVKSVRRGRGYPVKEFFRSFKKNLLKSTFFSLFFIALFTILLYNRKGANWSLVAMVFSAGLALWIFPVLSRFERKFTEIIMLAFVLMIRCLHYTVLLLAVAGALIYVYTHTALLPLLTAAVLPGVWVFASSFLIEKGMKPFMPKEAPEGVDAWWLE